MTSRWRQGQPSLSAIPKVFPLMTPCERVQEDASVEVGQADLMAAAGALQPSLSAAEVARYTSLRDSYSSQPGSRC